MTAEKYANKVFIIPTIINTLEILALLIIIARSLSFL
jgi:hypothetical protein